MNVHGPHYFTVDIFGAEIKITESIVVGWIVIAIITILILFVTHNMKKVPSKKQLIAEMIVTTANNMVRGNMGNTYMRFAPYMATIFFYSLFGTLICLFGFRPVTSDFNTTLTWALLTFVMIHYCKIRNHGIGGYLKEYAEPVAFMVPLNIIDELVKPVSLSFRHFGNIAGDMIITMLLYHSLIALSSAIHLPVPLTGIGLPAILSVYFDLFSGTMQAFIFVMLSMVFIGSAGEREEKSKKKA